MKYKKIDRDTRKIVVGYIKKHGGYVRQLASEREEIIEGGAKPPDGQPRGTIAGDPTADKVARLEALERCHRAQVVAAIDAAKLEIGNDIYNDKERLRLRQAIWLSTQDGQSNTYEVLQDFLCVSRRDFYRRKNSFLCAIAENLNL